MQTLKTILIDDEFRSRDLLKNYLKQHCPDVEVLSEAASADEAFREINLHKPELIFLDIRMPEKNGFDLLRMFSRIDFDVIFVSGFDEYAIHAFDFNAIDYILKPVDYRKLILSVRKAKSRQLQHPSGSLLHFIHSIDEKNELIRKISLHHNDRVFFIDVNTIVSIEAVRNYTKVTDSSGRVYISAKTLKEYERLFAGMDFLYKANKGIIVNLHHITSYSKGISCFITLTDEKVIEVSRRKKTEIIERIRKPQC